MTGATQRKVFCIAALLKSREQVAAILDLVPSEGRCGIEEILREFQGQDNSQLRSLWNGIRQNERKDRKNEWRHH